MDKEVEEFLKDLNGETKEDEFQKQDELDLFGENKEEEKPTEDTTCGIVTGKQIGRAHV